MSYVLLFVLLMVIAVLIKLSAMYLMKGSYSGGADSDDSADDDSSNDDSSVELDLIDADEMPGHTGGADAPLSQDQLRNMFDLYPSAKK